jgi:hypothetical protein
MESLSSLIRAAGPGDPLGVTLQAVLDSGLIVFSRDTDGRYVQLSETLAEQVGLLAPRGSKAPLNMRVFNDSGRLVPGTQYPASITRTTGKAQKSVRMRLVSDDDREIWLQMSTVPLERGTGGWSVLTIAADITDLQNELVELRARSTAQQSLVQLATKLAGRQISFSEARELLREPLVALVPEMNVWLGQQVGAEYESVILHQAYGAPRNGGDRARFQEAQRRRWSTDAVHLNQDVQDTDIYGASVVAEIPTTVRALVVAPLAGLPDGRLAALWAHSERPHGFSEWQVEGLELIGRLLGGAIEPRADELAEAS